MAGTPIMHFGSEAVVPHREKWNSVSPTESASENIDGCFDCNICLDSVHDPVVTLCGHLYCWPCICKWLQFQNSSFGSDGQPQCPVCKAYISTASLVPIYGRGTLSSDTKAKKPLSDLAIPERPTALGLNAPPAVTSMASDSNAFQPQQQPFHQQQYFPHPFSNYASMIPSSFVGTTSFFSPTVNMVGEMVFTGMFGGSDTTLFAYRYPNSYPIPGNVGPRLRRQEMQLNKSLNRVSIFLFCCIILCLVLF